MYDSWFPNSDVDAIDFLADLARGAKALELGIGTGRVALPLAAKNVEVHGVDASDSMIAQLRTKPGSDKIIVTKGNFAEVPVEDEYALIYVVFNTFFALSSQEAQVRCFRSVASHLTKTGCFVIEAFVPDVTRFVHGQANWATTVTADRVELDAGQHDPVTQRVMSQRIVITDEGVRLYPVQIRYAWPSELDLMAQLAGLRLRERWGDWRREPLTADSAKHISVYERAV